MLLHAVRTAVGRPAFAVPNVALKRVTNVKKYVVLPNWADHHPVTWAPQNLRRCDPKEQSGEPAPNDTVKYEILDDHWQAVLLPPQKTTAAPRVIQADIRYAWQADGRCLGAAFFDVEAAGAVNCPLELPEGFQLLQLTVDGLPVDAVRGEAGAWTVPLAAPGFRCAPGIALLRQDGPGRVFAASRLARALFVPRAETG